MRASVNFLCQNNTPAPMTLSDKKTVLREQLEGAGWESERLIAFFAGKPGEDKNNFVIPDYAGETQAK